MQTDSPDMQCLMAVCHNLCTWGTRRQRGMLNKTFLDVVWDVVGQTLRFARVNRPGSADPNAAVAQARSIESCCTYACVWLRTVGSFPVNMQLLRPDQSSSSNLYVSTISHPHVSFVICFEATWALSLTDSHPTIFSFFQPYGISLIATELPQAIWETEVKICAVSNNNSNCTGAYTIWHHLSGVEQYFRPNYGCQYWKGLVLNLRDSLSKSASA